MKDETLRQKYTNYMRQLLQSKHAELVLQNSCTEDEKGKVWYLPHFPVFSTNKPGETRVVFDCAAKCDGNSLNDCLLSGPSLTSTLVGVLLRFRQERIAMLADVENMFHQVVVSPEHRDLLRFLWYPEGNLRKQPEVYRMCVHIFGAASSPTCSNFALRKCREDFNEDKKFDVADVLNKNFYVDDMLKSVTDEKSGIMLAEQLNKTLDKGGFKLTKWLSTSEEIVSSIPEERRSPKLKDSWLNNELYERALGVRWNLQSDSFMFKIEMKKKPPTRRGMLSSISSVFDPLGFLAPVIMIPKLMLQELCRQKAAWDEELLEDAHVKWQTWLQKLPELSELKIRRCLKTDDFKKNEDIKLQVHCFSDASQSGYGAVAYMRMENKEGNVHVSFLFGKARVAPLKSLSIVRLELSAAVVATRLANIIRKQMDMQASQVFFWTDSTAVLKYIQNTDKHFDVFVSNRVTAIREMSRVAEWKYIPTALNPADEASRGVAVNEFLRNSKWLSGPEFLLTSEAHWPAQPELKSTVN